MATRNHKALTNQKLRALIQAKKAVALSDGDGLTFTLSEKGLAVWVLRFNFAKRRRELTLGRYPDLSLKDARDRAAAERARISSGIDVAAAKRQRQNQSALAWTVRQLVDDYKERSLSQKAASTQKLWAGYLTNWLVKSVGSMAVVDVKPTDIVLMLKKASGKGAGAVRTLRAATASVFEHAKGLAQRDDNPTSNIKCSSIIAQPPRRQGVSLKPDAVGALLRMLPNNRVGSAIRLHLITGVRPGELVGAAWAEFDLHGSSWTIPACRTKTKSGYVISYPTQAGSILSALREMSLGSEFLFPASHGALDKPIPYQTYRGWLRKLLENAPDGFPSIKAHDLRRTMRSGLASLGVRFEIAERAINHKLPQLAEIYDRNDYAAERKEALQLWANYLDELENKLM